MELQVEHDMEIITYWVTKGIQGHFPKEWRIKENISGKLTWKLGFYPGPSPWGRFPFHFPYGPTRSLKGFRVQGLGCRVKGSGFLGFRV